MAREARKLSDSGNYYVVLKGEELFVTDEDKKMFLQILEKNFATGIVHGYELGSEEIQLVVKEGEKGISMTMKPVTTSYARYFNRTHDREGKLFKGRFYSEPLETDEEIEECIKNLGNDIKKKQPPKSDKTEKSSRAKKVQQEKRAKNQAHEEEQTNTQQEKQPARKQSLPAWLL
jgi:hypothetical protein